MKILDYQVIVQTCFILGKKRLIPICGQHQGMKLISTFEYETGKISCSEERYDTETFMGFLRKLLTAYPTGKIVMILDNARIHHAPRIQRFLAENRNQLELIFLPPYHPELNLLEVVSKWPKESLIQLVFFGNGQKIILAVQATLQDINQKRLIGFA